MPIIERALAKINLTLEVLGKRDDGYHEVRTVMQTISLHDDLFFTHSADPHITLSGDHLPAEADLIYRAATLLRDRTGPGAGARIEVSKRIPIGAGLGGGSADAAATIRGLRRLWKLDMSDSTLASLAAEIGSDETFLLRGGTALGSGRGEIVSRLPDPAETWFVLLVPRFTIPGKTARMYSALSHDDLSNGSKTQKLVTKLRAGGQLTTDDIFNAFDRVAHEKFPGLHALHREFASVADRCVHVTGSGPGLFTLARDQREARDITARLAHLDSRLYAVRSVAAENDSAI